MIGVPRITRDLRNVPEVFSQTKSNNKEMWRKREKHKNQ